MSLGDPAVVRAEPRALTRLEGPDARGVLFDAVAEASPRRIRAHRTPSILAAA